MKKMMVVIAILVLSTFSISSIHADMNTLESNDEHNWVEHRIDYHEVDGGTHEYSYWKNFIKRERTCHITHVIKTITYYCDKHDHIKVDTLLEKTKHSHHHSK